MVGMKYTANMVWKGPQFDRAQRDAGRKGTRAAGEFLLAQSVPLAPKDTGALRSSGTVKGVNAEPVALVIFDTPYAVIQHEAEEYHHDDGQAKYLEQPMVEYDATMKQIIAQALREGFAGA
jgi:hypothetical protein